MSEEQEKSKWINKLKKEFVTNSNLCKLCNQQLTVKQSTPVMIKKHLKGECPQRHTHTQRIDAKIKECKDLVAQRRKQREEQKKIQKETLADLPTNTRSYEKHKWSEYGPHFIYVIFTPLFMSGLLQYVGDTTFNRIGLTDTFGFAFFILITIFYGDFMFAKPSWVKAKLHTCILYEAIKEINKQYDMKWDLDDETKLLDAAKSMIYAYEYSKDRFDFKNNAQTGYPPQLLRRLFSISPQTYYSITRELPSDNDIRRRTKKQLYNIFMSPNSYIYKRLSSISNPKLTTKQYFQHFCTTTNIVIFKKIDTIQGGQDTKFEQGYRTNKAYYDKSDFQIISKYIDTREMISFEEITANKQGLSDYIEEFLRDIMPQWDNWSSNATDLLFSSNDGLAGSLKFSYGGSTSCVYTVSTFISEFGKIIDSLNRANDYGIIINPFTYSAYFLDLYHFNYAGKLSIINGLVREHSEFHPYAIYSGSIGTRPMDVRKWVDTNWNSIQDHDKLDSLIEIIFHPHNISTYVIYGYLRFMSTLVNARQTNYVNVFNIGKKITDNHLKNMEDVTIHKYKHYCELNNKNLINWKDGNDTALIPNPKTKLIQAASIGYDETKQDEYSEQIQNVKSQIKAEEIRLDLASVYICDTPYMKSIAYYLNEDKTQMIANDGEVCSLKEYTFDDLVCVISTDNEEENTFDISDGLAAKINIYPSTCLSEYSISKRCMILSDSFNKNSIKHQYELQEYKQANCKIVEVTNGEKTRYFVCSGYGCFIPHGEE
eukprot:337684_1